MSSNFFDKIHDNPIIAAANNEENLHRAINSPCEIIFLLTGSIFNLKTLVNQVKDSGKEIYIHIDLLDGFSKDIVSLNYIHDNMKPHGIITTKSSLIKAAKGMGMFAIQRLFMIDGLSLESGINSIKTTRPDAVEIMPGIMPKITSIIHNETRIPIITGGLIMDKEDVINSLKAGAVGISTSKESIWYT